MEHIPIGHIVRPCDVIDVLHALDIHRKAFKAIGDLNRDGLDVVTADLLEICELRDLHAVQPDLPAEPPRTEGRRLPVILNKANVMFRGTDAEPGKTLEIELLDVVRRRLHDNLELMMLIEPVRIVPIAAVCGSA